jgi:YrbI family 3-deoxy-D-manno-octulosonate 8-phosphate phosphatase
VPAGQNPFKMWRFEDAGKPLKPLLESDRIAEPYNAPRQALPPVYWQTGHIDAIRVATLSQKHSLTGDNVHPFVIDPRYTVDIDSPADWAKYESLVYSGDLQIVSPGKGPRPMPAEIKLIVLDFDGVVTDNQVITDEKGREAVTASRADGMLIPKLREKGIEMMVLSSEKNPVVEKRSKKMDVEAVYGMGVSKKGEVMKEVLEKKGIRPEHVVFVGNDLNDLPCFEIAAWAVAVADAYPEVLRHADFVLTKKGGHGAVRELCEIVLKQLSDKEK